jgi:hypothetical protein
VPSQVAVTSLPVEQEPYEHWLALLQLWPRFGAIFGQALPPLLPAHDHLY